ncbi:S8 family serine peptidase [Nitrosospira multiformis]|nr:S8 family serine peptidase [Nitrosospira multiformis]
MNFIVPSNPRTIWIILSFLILASCAHLHGIHREPYRYLVDPSIVPSQSELPGLNGGPPRKVAVLVGPTGRKDEFVVNEVIYRPRNPQELQSFLTAYGGTVLRDGKPFLLPEVAARNPEQPSSGWYLIRIDPQRSGLNDLATSMERGGSRGLHVFSSEDAARLGALLAREKVRNGLTISPNILLHHHRVEEHPDGAGGFLDAERWWWMTEDDDPNMPGDQGLSIGVIHAWRYLSYKEVPSPGVWTPPIVAIVDSGFDVDAAGRPINAQPDFFPSRPLQMDLIDFDGSADGPSPSAPWHGQEVAAVATALHANRFGGAGTGSQIAWPMLIRIDATAYMMADAIRSATINGAQVVNISISGGCDVWDWICGIPPNDIYAAMESAALFAASSGTIVVANSGNEGVSLDDDDRIPCETSTVICVGGINREGYNLFNYGSPVDIWAPSGIASTVIPGRVGLQGMDAICCFHGTSAATPFVSGVVALMKALDPSLPWFRVEEYLKETANPSPDPKVRGYIDAFRAVERVRRNMPPSITIDIPRDGITIPYNRNIYLHAKVVDPERNNDFFGTVVFTSDRDGELCRTTGYVTSCEGPIPSLGPHIISATADDQYGGITAAAPIAVTVINQVPVASIILPNDGATFFADQMINFRGYGFDWDELIPPANLIWTSSLNGTLGSGQEIQTPLNIGTHAITLTATDSSGQSGQASILLTVQAAAGHPTARILAPATGTMFGPGMDITFQGEGTDPQEGPLPDSALLWYSDVDGFLGMGRTLTKALSGPAVPCNPETVPHTITLKVRDRDGNEATHFIQVWVGYIC